MKPDEIAFYNLLRQSHPETYTPAQPLFVRDVIASLAGTMHHKRCWYLLGKWSARGWYDSGVALDLGWFTDKAPVELTPPPLHAGGTLGSGGTPMRRDP